MAVLLRTLLVRFEGYLEDLIRYTLNEDGEIVDEDGYAVGRVDLIPVEEQKKAIEGAAGGAKGTADDDNIDLGDNVERAKNTAEDVGDDGAYTFDEMDGRVYQSHYRKHHRTAEGNRQRRA